MEHKNSAEKKIVRIIVGILVLIAAIIALAVVRTGGRNKKYAADIQSASDIAASAVHWTYDRSLVQPKEIENDNERRNDSHIDIDSRTDAGITCWSLDSLDVWDLASYLYGISYTDTTRALQLITIEEYGYSPLSYYVACCCIARANGIRYGEYIGYLWGYSDMFTAFGEADPSYTVERYWDHYIADYAYVAYRQALMDEEWRYVAYCNGMAEPYDYIYAEFTGSGMIYVW